MSDSLIQVQTVEDPDDDSTSSSLPRLDSLALGQTPSVRVSRPPVIDTAVPLASVPIAPLSAGESTYFASPSSNLSGSTGGGYV